MRTAVKVICDNNSWITEINTDIEGARAYFIGQRFTREDEDGTETFDTVTRIEQLTSWNCPECFPKLCIHYKGE